MNNITCDQCDGTGLVWNSNHTEGDTCEKCGGYGTVERQFGEEKLTREQLNYDQTNNT